jgi:hypothetical protein
MTTTDTVLLIIVTSLLSLLLLAAIVLKVVLVKLAASVRRVVNKAENVVDSVESAAEVFKDTQGRLAFIKLIRNIIKLAQRRHK